MASGRTPSPLTAADEQLILILHAVHAWSEALDWFADAARQMASRRLREPHWTAMCERVAEARAATLPYFRDVVEAYTLPMPREVLQRPYWHGRPVALGELFVLRKIRREAKAVLFTHQLGWEVQLIIDAQAEGVQTQVCRTQEKVLSTGEQWKAAMGGKGWQ